MEIAVVARSKEEGLSKETYEAVNVAANIRTDGWGSVRLWIIGADNRKAIEEATQLPIAAVLSTEHSALKDYVPEMYLNALTVMHQKHPVPTIIFPGDIAGRELAVRLACRLEGQSVTDCVSLRHTNSGICALKPAFSGNINIQYRLPKGLSIISMRPGAVGSRRHAIPNNGKKASVEELLWEPAHTPTWIRKRGLTIQFKDDFIGLRCAIVGGAGIGGREGFELLDRLASRIGAVVAGTRPAVNNSWLTLDKLIGQSGKVMSPDLCIVAAASGATPFLAGINNSKVIIAINIDKDAPIFRACDIGVVDDYRPIIKWMLDH